MFRHMYRLVIHKTVNMSQVFLIVDVAILYVTTRLEYYATTVNVAHKS